MILWSPIDNDGLNINTSLNDIILKDSKKSNKAYIEEQFMIF